MENRIYWYVRVSSIDQNEDRQIMTLVGYVKEFAKAQAV